MDLNKSIGDKLNFDVQPFYDRAKKIKDKVKLEGVTINLPFISFNLTADDKEKKIAREIIIRLRDKRVLNSKECCENCIDNSLKSILEIRQILVDKQVEIEKTDSSLFLLVDFALFGVKKFLTYTEFFDSMNNKREYFDTLNIIRGHLLKILDQLGKIAELPTDFGFCHDFSEIWEKEIYFLTE